MEFELISAGNFFKLEKVGGYTYYRPSPAAVWENPDKKIHADVSYKRYEEGKGEWTFNNKKVPDNYIISIFENIKVEIQHTSFGHLGVFPEQIENWKRLFKNVESGEKVLNLFAYTGIASLVCAAKGAEVAHVDASKTSVAWAKRNQELSNLQDKKIRWLVDDVQKFVQKEIRRENTYEWIILDPPSFGRGKNNEVWQIEEHLSELMKNLFQLKSQNFKGILLSSHSPGYSPLALENILKSAGFNTGKFITEEMTITHPKTPLPSGASSWALSF